MSQTWDRGGEDVGNILALEHVNVWIPSQQLATAFYVVGMGFTRDPYLMVSLDNMWVNLGQQQFHLITKDPQVVRGCVGIVVPDLDALTARLSQVKGMLEGTKFTYAVDNGHVNVTCPWGNRLRCHAPAPEFGHMTLGMPYVEFTVRRGVARGIASFYNTVMGARAAVGDRSGAPAAIVRVGPGQRLIFRETDEPLPAYDGHHIAIYVSDFSTPHRFLAEHGIITEESDRYQYRFVNIVDPQTRECLFEVEHEVRSLTHPMYLRPLINRNAAQRQRTYQRGHDAFVPGMA
jgi:catechol 2,3-dioxygenase-like lactoylglutathione lyase family enzyme